MTILLLLKIAIGIAAGIVGAIIGLRRLLLLTIAGVAGFISVNTVTRFYKLLALQLEHFISPQNSIVISIIILALIPLFLLYYLGRELLVRLSITESMSKTVDQILGLGYAVSLYLISLAINLF